MKEKEEWCILKPEEERLNPYYKDYDDWFKWNCRGCSNFFSCGKVKENNIELLKNLSFIPEKCNERVPEW